MKGKRIHFAYGFECDEHHGELVVPVTMSDDDIDQEISDYVLGELWWSRVEDDE